MKVVCPVCHGSGYWKKPPVYLGPYVYVPSYSSPLDTCPGCHGTGVQDDGK